MASDQALVDYIADQLRGAGRITTRKMFGEYAVYCDGKVVGLVCDNQLFVKPTEPGLAFAGSVERGPPYPGARPHLMVTERIDDRDWMEELISVTAAAVAARPARPARKAAAPKGGEDKTADRKGGAGKATARKPGDRKPARRAAKRQGRRK